MSYSSELHCCTKTVESLGHKLKIWTNRMLTCLWCYMKSQGIMKICSFVHFIKPAHVFVEQRTKLISL